MCSAAPAPASALLKVHARARALLPLNTNRASQWPRDLAKAAADIPKFKGRDYAVSQLAKYGDPAKIVKTIASSNFEGGYNSRQYGVCSMTSCAAFTGTVPGNCYGDAAKYKGCFAGAVNGDDSLRFVVSVQGNVLTSKKVLTQASSFASPHILGPVRECQPVSLSIGCANRITRVKTELPYLSKWNSPIS